jgi:hypothetical protein
MIEGRGQRKRHWLEQSCGHALDDVDGRIAWPTSEPQMSSGGKPAFSAGDMHLRKPATGKAASFQGRRGPARRVSRIANSDPDGWELTNIVESWERNQSSPLGA